MSDDNWRNGYDLWKLATPPEYETLDEEPRCTCYFGRRDKYCAVHGIDPDDERDRLADDGWEPDR